MSISLKIKTACVSFIALILLLGILAVRQAIALSGLAVTIYDHSFVGMSYVNLADEAFLQLTQRIERANTRTAPVISSADVQPVLDNLEIAIERAGSVRTRHLAQAVSNAVTTLPRLPPSQLRLLELPLEKTMARLVRRFASEGLAARDAAAMLARQDLVLFAGEAVIAIVLASALCWAAIRHLSPPLVSVVATLKDLSSGRSASPLPEALLRRADEIGEVARATKLYGEAMHRNTQLAHFDTLTGLPNRKLFNDRLAQALAATDLSGPGTVLVCLDLDRFKAVNDTLGHAAGDRLLCEVAARLSVGLRNTDTVARLGGDEFAMVLPLMRLEGAAILATRIIEDLSRPYDMDGLHACIGVSIGIAAAEPNTSDPVALMRGADLALYRAKQDGRGVYRIFEASMDAAARRSRVLESDLRTASERGELQLYYQPVCDTNTLAVLGREALLRWHHPERGLVAPGEFIPIAEESRLILSIGRWVIAQACSTASAWPDGGQVAVNVSPVQFSDPTLVATVAQSLALSGLAPGRLELEITESVLIDDTDRVLDVLRQLKNIGVRITLDDFGTGYSSLSYLRRFPFDKIKIDRSFTKGLGIDNDADTLVGCIVALGHSLSLEVTAEGVETQHQVDRLRQMGCDYLQGFLIGKPAPDPMLFCKAERTRAAVHAAAA